MDGPKVSERKPAAHPPIGNCLTGFVCTAIFAAILKIAGDPIPEFSSVDAAVCALAWLGVWLLAVVLTEICDMADSVDAAIRQGGGK